MISARVLLNLLSVQKILSVMIILFSLNEVLEFAEDIEIDVPKIWDYLGEILSPVVAHSVLPLSFLSSIFPTLVIMWATSSYRVLSL